MVVSLRTERQADSYLGVCQKDFLTQPFLSGVFWPGGSQISLLPTERKMEGEATHRSKGKAVLLAVTV